MNHSALFARLRRHNLNHWAQQLESESGDWLVNHGDYARWSAALASLPALDNVDARFDSAAVTIDAECGYRELIYYLRNIKCYGFE